jgi:malonyl-CoA O-methyltransferase
MFSKNNFNAAASTYRDYAEVQKYIAARLIDVQKPEAGGRSILEIGCGTGFLTEQIKEKFAGKWKKFHAIDPAKNMIETCKKDPKLKGIEFFAESAEDFLSSKNFQSTKPGVYKNNADAEYKYDLVMAASVFHWIEDLGALLKNIRSHMEPGGEFIFSTYGTLMFLEFYSTLGEELSLPHYLSKDQWRELLEKTGFTDIHCTEEIYKKRYQGAKDILRMINKTGVNLKTSKTISPKKLQKFIKDYDTTHMTSDGNVVLTYDVLYIRAAAGK